MSEESGRESRSIATYVIYAVAFVVLYVLSFGPVAAIIGHLGLHDMWPAFMTLYHPIIWLHENTLLKEPLEWYVNLWVNPVMGL